ncbi:Na(+)-translocating NADH-quinone reductasesubunit F [Striga asiatica]|uniref:Na(+)-translocating NADH-quinone reductasesubunit F n=1 Tax=Striga asiatica TaxID=4170 RepID=A0A5A7RGP9_STRAF|nr:Na(+)-translocating NADH-quinone reductasesubunit F [Striga asiatica]
MRQKTLELIEKMRVEEEVEMDATSDLLWELCLQAKVQKEMMLDVDFCVEVQRKGSGEAYKRDKIANVINEYTLSINELHPQWLTNPPVLRCASTSACGAHPTTTIPLSPTLPRNPSGRASSRGIDPSAGNRTTHTKLAWQDSSPLAISAISSLDGKHSLPNETYMVERGPFPSSHRRISELPEMTVAASGPTVRSFFRKAPER